MSDTTTTEATPPTLVHKLAAEALGTFVLVFFGVGSAIIALGDSSGDELSFGAVATYTAIGLTFGLTVVVGAYAFGRISGAHFNPAVSIGAGLSGRMAWKDVGLYAGTQVAAGFLAALTLFVLMQGWEDFDAEGRMGQNSFGDDGTGYAWWAAFLLELLTTAIFVFIILAVTDKRNSAYAALAPLAIGLSLAMIHFATMGATGTSVNPARSIGPALFAGSDYIIMLWLFILAPVIGGAAAGVLYPLLFGRDGDPVPGSGLTLSKPGGQQGYQQQWQGGQQGQLPPGQWDQQGYQQGQQQWPQQGQQGQQQWPQQGDQQQWQQGQQGQHAAQPEQQWGQQEQQWPQQPEPPTQHQQQWPQQDYTPPEDDGRTQIRPEGQ